MSKETQTMDDDTLTEQKAMIRQSDCVDKQSTELRMTGRSENVQYMRAHPFKKVAQRNTHLN